MLFFPGVDETTLTGYIITISIHIIVSVLGSIGLAACDVFYAVTLSNVPIMARLTEDEINQLNDQLEGKSEENGLKWQQRFYNILVMHQEMIK